MRNLMERRVIVTATAQRLAWRAQIRAQWLWQAFWSDLHIRSPHSERRHLPGEHTRTQEIHETITLGERMADAVASGMGSWRFIGFQTALVVCWMLANAWLLSRPFDPFPFILLNLAFSTQAAYAAPILQMASNRAAAKDRLRDDREAVEVDMMTRQLKLLETINRQQLQILHALHQPTGQTAAQAPGQAIGQAPAPLGTRTTHPRSGAGATPRASSADAAPPAAKPAQT